MMKNKESLEKVVLKYSGMATAILGAGATHGQIVWTDIQDSTVTKNGAFYEVNINPDMDTIVDFRIYQIVDSLSSAFDVTGVIIKDANGATNQVVGLDYGNYNYAFRLGVGDSIGTNRIFRGIHPARNVGYMAFEASGAGYPNSQWVDTANGITNGFLGVRLKADLNDTIRNFYGWIRLDIAKDLRSFTIKDFAYQKIEDQAITAGEGSPIGVEEVYEAEKAQLAQRGLFLDINLPESYLPKLTLNILDLSGKLVKSYDLTGHKNTVELENLPKGIHIANVVSNGLESAKKVVVY
jgi:hypothetical protein